MGGKSTTSTQQVTIPPEVMARYNAVNTRAENVAQKPFQQYGGEFVAPINQQQQAGFQNINQAATSAQPYYQGAAGMTLAGSQGVGPLTGGQINQYMSPYLNSVVGTTLQNLGQEQAIQRQGQIGDAIKAGAFGGDRSGLAAANLARQQGLAYGKTAADLLNTGYGQAVQTAQGQQGVQAQDLTRLMQGGAQLGGLGAAQQQAALQGAQAQVGAGTLAQQTEQADRTARYQQFLQERGYDFQVAQFLANIAMGTGALSGSTTTTTQPQSLFSDERLKENVEPVGELNDGQTIYRYNYKGDPRTQIGLIAQEVERSHPEAVGESEGYRTVDYGRATDEAAMASRGGLVPEGMGERMAFAPGGLVDPNDMQALLTSQAQSFGPFSQAGLYGGDKGGGLGAAGYVPSAKLPTPKLITAGSAPKQQASGLGQAMSAAGQIQDLGQKAAKAYDFGKKGLEFGKKSFEEMKGLGSGKPDIASAPAADLPAVGAKTASLEGGVMPSSEDLPDLSTMFANRGGLVPGYAAGGAMNPTNPYEMTEDPLQDVLNDQSKNEIEPLKPASAPGGGGGGGGLGDALKLAGSLGSMASAASSAGTGISALMALLPFSDERLKDNIEPVGKLYDGQPVYRYDMNGGPTQIGLMAQEAGLRRPDAVGERGGYMTLDYDRATEDAAGLMPRQGYAKGGPADEDLAVRTIAAEMSGKSPEEARAIAAVIENRLKSGRYGETYGDVVKARGQFEPWSKPDAPNYPMRFSPDSQRYRDARAAFEARGDDPTGGAQNFYAPVAQKALGRDEPSWARGREGLDIGATRFFNLGEGADRPAMGAKETSFEGGLNPSGKPETKSAGLFSAPNKFGSEKPQDWSEFLTSRQFIVPLLSGIGAAATTPTRNLGTALAAGLGAGAQAYGGLEKQQADITQGGVDTALKTQALSRRAVFTENGITFVQLPNGKTLRIDEWIKAGQPAPIGGEQSAEQALTIARRSGLLKEGPEKGAPGTAPNAAPSAAPSAAPEGPEGAKTEPEKEGAGAAPLLPAAKGYSFVVNPSKEALADAEKEATEQLISGPARETKLAEAQKERDKIINQRSAANGMVAPLGELAGALLTYNNEGVLQTGFGSGANVQFNRVLNQFLRAVGAPEEFQSKIPVAANIEDKVSRLITEAQAGNLDQRAVSALDKLKEGIANRSMEPDAIATVLADLFVERQKALDRGAYLDKFDRAAQGMPGSQVGARLDANFKKQFTEQEYAKDRAILKNIFSGGAQGSIQTSKGREPIINYILNKGEDKGLQKRLNESGIGELVDKKFNRPGLSRFILGVAN